MKKEEFELGDRVIVLECEFLTAKLTPRYEDEVSAISSSCLRVRRLKKWFKKETWVLINGSEQKVEKARLY